MHNSIGIGIAQVQDKMGGASFNKAARLCAERCQILRIDHKLYRTLDSLRITPHNSAMLVENGALLLEILKVIAYAIPDISVLGNDPQRQLLAASSNYKGRSRLLHWLRLTVGIFDLVIAPLKARSCLCPHALD